MKKMFAVVVDPVRRTSLGSRCCARTILYHASCGGHTGGKAGSETQGQET